MIERSSFYVIAKTYADEPRRLWATVEDGALLVANDTKEAWIGYPSKLIFEYEETLFTQMRSAFASGSTEKLAQLWGAARQLKMTELASPN